MSVEKITEVGGFARFTNESVGFTVFVNDSLKLIKKLELRGLYISLLMLPDNWKIHKSQLCEQFSIGHNKIDSYFSQLVKLGLLSIKKTRNEQGVFTDTDYTIHIFPRELSTAPVSRGMVSRRLDTDSYKEKDIYKEKEKTNIADPCPDTASFISEVESLGEYRWKDWQKIYPNCNSKRLCVPILKKMSKQEYLELLEGTKIYLDFLNLERSNGFVNKQPQYATTFLRGKTYKEAKNLFENEKSKSKTVQKSINNTKEHVALWL